METTTPGAGALTFEGIRLKRNLSVIAMAKKIGCTRAAVYRILRGGTTDVRTLDKVATALSIDGELALSINRDLLRNNASLHPLK